MLKLEMGTFGALEGRQGCFLILSMPHVTSLPKISRPGALLHPLASVGDRRQQLPSSSARDVHSQQDGARAARTQEGASSLCCITLESQTRFGLSHMLLSCWT
jgi:hypothetical protein